MMVDYNSVYKIRENLNKPVKILGIFMTDI